MRRTERVHLMTGMFVVFALLVSGICTAGEKEKAKEAGVQVGQTPAEVEAAGWINAKEAPSIKQKDKVYLVVFFATDSPDSKQLIKMLDVVQQKAEAQGLVIVTASDEDKEAVTKLTEAVKPKIPVGYGSKSVKAYGAEALPHAVIVDKKGKITYSGSLRNAGDALQDALVGPAPTVGSVPPPVQVKGWLNAKKMPKLSELKGKKVAVVEFWATWCPPCRKTIPHLNELYEKHNDKVVFMGLTNESKDKVVKFMKNLPMKYPVGYGSDSGQAYRVRGIPNAVVVGADGKIVWRGHPASPEFEQAIKTAVQKMEK